MKRFLLSFAVAGLLLGPACFGTLKAKAAEFTQPSANEQIQKQNVQHFQQLAQDDDQSNSTSDD